MAYYCVFCEIIARREPAIIEYEDDDVLVFHNRLDWADVMLLAVPKQHLYQDELWTTDVMAKVSRVAVQMGERHCPKGFRIVSNFGAHAMQSQPHAHVHVVDGKHLRRYPKTPADVHYEEERVVVFHNKVQREPVTLLVTPREPLPQSELWRSDVINDIGRVATTLGGEHCGAGFRLFSDFGLEPSPADTEGHLHVIGGTYLGEYA
jgi:histidine triad (HIT) family protein